MDASLVAFVILVFSMISISVQETSVGTVCSTDLDCPGENEFCDIRTDITPPCKKGRCTCVPCFIFSGGRCVPENDRTAIGDSCTGELGDVFTIPGTTCVNKKVACRANFKLSDGKCLLDRSCADGKACPNQMRCNENTGNCRCQFDFERFDENRQGCIAREFNDNCANDVHCDSDSTKMNGFTSGGGACIEGKCGCKDDQRVVNITWYNAQADKLINKSICITTEVARAQTNLGRGKVCTVNPVKWSFNGATSTCQPGFICYQCPEDTGDDFDPKEDGYCRRPNSPDDGFKLDCMGVIAAINASRGVINVNVKPNVNEINITIDVTTNRTLAPVPVSTLLKPCSSNLDCKGSNEVCPNFPAYTPSCKKSKCACSECFVAVKNRCVAKKYLTSIGSPCTGTAEEVITVPYAACVGGKVMCPNNTRDTDGPRCYADLSCDITDPSRSCPPGTICTASKRCTCIGKGRRWNDDKWACVARSYNDPCATSDDCTFAGSVISGEGFSKLGVGVCAASKCYCGNGFKAVTIGVIDTKTRDFVSQTICVVADATIDLTNGTCHTDPINANSDVKVCRSTHICQRCNDDSPPTTSNWQFGECREVNADALVTPADCQSRAGTVTASIILVALAILFRLV